MTTLFRIPEANFDTAPVLYDLPVKDGLVALGFLNQNATKTGRNLATGGLFTVLGAPTINAGYAQLSSGLKYVDTGVIETDAISIVAVCKTPDTSITSPARPTFAGNQGSGVFSIQDPARLSAGCSLYALSDTQMTWSATRETSGSTTTSSNWNLTVPDVTSWACYSCRADDTRQNIKDLTRSLSNVSAVSPSRPRIPAQGNLRIGSAGSGATGTGNAHVAIVAIYNRWIDDSEESEVYVNFQTYMADLKSITI